jgi:hypothetical protein
LISLARKACSSPLSLVVSRYTAAPPHRPDDQPTDACVVVFRSAIARRPAARPTTPPAPPPTPESPARPQAPRPPAPVR